MPLSRRAHPAQRTRHVVGAASGATYLAVTAVIGISVRSEAEAAEAIEPPADDVSAPTTIPETLAFAGSARPAPPALPPFPEMTAIDGVATTLVEIEALEAADEGPAPTDAPAPRPTTTIAPPQSTVAPTAAPATTTESTDTVQGETSTSAAPGTTAAPTTAPTTSTPPTTAPTTSTPPTTAPTTTAPTTTPTSDAS